MYYVETNNRFNQILVFKKKKHAKEWLKSATMWSNEQIENNIHKSTKTTTYYNIFPKGDIND